MAKQTTQEKFALIEEELNECFAERSQVIRGCLVALLSGKHVLLLGPPGTGKSLLARSVCNAITGSRFFEKLLTRFTGQEELFGPIAASQLKNDKFLRKIDGYLPDAHIAFLDEIYKANSAILNSLLTLANEGIFHNDGVPVKTPLMSIIGASNEIPDGEDGLEAFDDRLHIRFIVQRITDRANMEKMLRHGSFTSSASVTISELIQAKADVAKVTISPQVMAIYLDLWHGLTKKKFGVGITDRVFKQAIDIIKAEAWLEGRDTVREEDFEILQHVFWKDPANKKDIHLEILNTTNPEKSKITDIFMEIENITNKVLKSNKATSPAEGLEVLNKLKEKRQVVEKLIKSMEASGKNVCEVREMATKMNVLLHEVASSVVGIEVKF